VKAELSIVIVSWNTADLLRQCLRSILSGTHEQSIEIIVVDNGSSDGTPEAVQKEFPSVTLIQNHANLGFAKANNIAIRRSTGRYVCLINPDVVVGEGCLDRMLAYMDQQPSIGILGPKILNPDSTIQFSCRRFPSLWNALCRAMALDALFPSKSLFGDPLMRSWAHDSLRQVDMLSGCFWMIRREALDAVGSLDEDFFMYGEDLDYCQRCWQQGWEIVYFPQVAAVHYGGASSCHFPVRFQVESLQSTLRYWKKYRSRPAQMAFSGIHLVHQFRRILQGTIRYIFNPSQKKRFLNEIKAGVKCSLLLLRISSL